METNEILKRIESIDNFNPNTFPEILAILKEITEHIKKLEN